MLSPAGDQRSAPSARAKARSRPPSATTTRSPWTAIRSPLERPIFFVHTCRPVAVSRTVTFSRKSVWTRRRPETAAVMPNSWVPRSRRSCRTTLPEEMSRAAITSSSTP